MLLVNLVNLVNLIMAWRVEGIKQHQPSGAVCPFAHIPPLPSPPPHGVKVDLVLYFLYKTLVSANNKT